MTGNALFVNELFHRLKHGEILHTISTARDRGMTPEELRRVLGESVTTSLNHDREYIASRRYVSKKCDRKGFWRKDGKVFHSSGSISAVLKRLVNQTPWGLTESEAEKLTGRECSRMLHAMVEQNVVQRASINGVWVYGRKRNFSLQLKERMTNDRVKILPSDGDRRTISYRLRKS